MAIEFEDGLKNLGNLIAWADNNMDEQTRNEATTRLHLIDNLLFECLGWDRSECKAEDRYDGKYTDYSFHCPECLFIFEAKKEGLYFELPVGTSRLVYDLSFFKKQRKGKGIYKAIKQAIEYCQSRGTPYGGVCNGHQLIVFIGSRNDGYPPLNGKALVFDSLESLYNNFLVAWQCLSKPGILSRRLSLELQEVTAAPVPEKLSKRITSYPGFKRRNIIQTDLQILSSLFMEDVASLGGNGNEREFLGECYCESGALSQYAEISKEILKARYSAMFEKATEGPSTAPVTTKKGLSPEFLAESLSRRPILLIGDIGVGKTMFIKHFHQVRGTDLLSDALVFYIDFGASPAFEENISQFIASEVQRQLLEKFNIDIEARKFVFGVLHGDVERFNDSIYSDIRETAPDTFRQKRVEYIEERMTDKENYLRLCINHIYKGHRKQVVIFLDNVDQRSYEFQDKAFLVAQTLAASWPATIYLSIRPETFHRSRRSGTIGAYHPKAFTISPPRVDEVIRKRLEYGLSLLKKGAALGLGAGVSVRTTNLSDYISILIYSFENNKHLISFLDNMPGGNIRLALNFLEAFIGSGHVNTEKILNKYREKGSYLVPLHEFIRAVTYVDHEHYSPDASEIFNLFDVSTPDSREHFLSPILLAQLDRWSQSSHLGGYVSIADIYAYAQGLGFSPYQIDSNIKGLVRHNLIELPTKSREIEIVEPVSYYRVTTIGAYYVRRLIRRFTYIDAMIVDTPIIDQRIRAQITDVDSIGHRLARTKIFCAYLDEQWKVFSDRELVFQWPAVRWAIGRDIDYVTEKLSIREDAEEADQPEKVG